VANNIPGNGIPIALSSGRGVTSGSFTLQYNPSLLTISGVVSKVAGASFTLVSNNTVTGTAVLSLSSPSSLTSTATPIAMGSLLATVPLSATVNYGVNQLLHFSSEQLNGTAGPIAVTNADAVQVAAYIGDVTDKGGPLSLSDATAVFAVAGAVPNTAAQTIPGFAAFPNLDPAIIGDVSLQGSVTSTDAGAMLQEVGGAARITIPYAPIGLPVTPAVHSEKVDSGQWTVDSENPLRNASAVSARPAAVLQAEVPPTPTVPGNPLSSAVVEQVFSNLLQNSYSLSITMHPQPTGNWSQPNVGFRGYLASTCDLPDAGSPWDGDTDPLVVFFAREGAKVRALPL
jgi:hypothetical protein